MPPIVRRELEGLPNQEFQNRERLLPRLVEIISNLQLMYTSTGSH